MDKEKFIKEIVWGTLPELKGMSFYSETAQHNGWKPMHTKIQYCELQNTGRTKILEASKEKQEKIENSQEQHWELEENAAALLDIWRNMISNLDFYIQWIH